MNTIKEHKKAFLRKKSTSETDNTDMMISTIKSSKEIEVKRSVDISSQAFLSASTPAPSQSSGVELSMTQPVKNFGRKRKSTSAADNTDNMVISTQKSSKEIDVKRPIDTSSQASVSASTPASSQSSGVDTSLKAPITASIPATSQSIVFGKRQLSLTQPEKKISRILASKCSFCDKSKREANKTEALIRKLKASNERAIHTLKEQHRLEIQKKEDDLNKVLNELSDMKANYKKMVGSFEWIKNLYKTLDNEKNKLQKKYEKKLILQAEMNKLLVKYT